MATPPPPPANQPPAQGLSHSTPLVKVSNVHQGIRPIAGGLTSVGADHPLATYPEPTALLPTRTPPSPQPSTAARTPTIAAVPPSSTLQATADIALGGPMSPVAKSLDALADQFLSAPSYRTSSLNLPPILKPPALPQNQSAIEKIRTLAERRAWGDVLQVAGDLLRSPTSKYAPIYTSLVQNTTSPLEGDPALALLQSETIEILTLECHAWLKLRRYSDVGREVDRWDFIVDAANAPLWIPASLYILAAESLQYTDPHNPTKCCDILYELRLTYKDQPQWLASINNGLSNAFVRQLEWRLALVSLDDMRANGGGLVDWEVSQDATLAPHREELVAAFDAEILSRQGRILLQVGALPEARRLFDEAKRLGESISPLPHYLTRRLPGQLMLNDGLMEFSLRHLEESMTAFKAAIDLLRQYHDDGTYDGRLFTGPVCTESTHSLLSSCWNNMGLAALYTCRMKEAVRMMESLVRENPTLYLTERMAFNLCTLYELGADTTTSARKKRVLQLVAKRFYLHDIGPENFRVT
jgi:tetratricopeptide (TPR) repeat protein